MDNEKVAAAMQDNVTQAGLADEMLQCDMWRGGILVPIDLATRIRNRLASTAQPEVKALVEALEKIAGKNDLSEAPPAEIEAFAHAALHDCEIIARQALAAYHEAQP